MNVDALPVLLMARRLLARSLSVIPVPRPRPGAPAGEPGDGKVPAIKWREYQERRPTDDELAHWFGRNPMNLAVITGAVSGVVVIDADEPAALRWCTSHLAYTPWQTKTARGYHLWYRHPGVRVANRARLRTDNGQLAIDVRGDGGYVIAPGSVHASGAEYTFAGDWSVPRDQVPRFWPEWLERPCPGSKTGGTRVVPLVSGDRIERARRYLGAIPRPEIGSGSDSATLKAACRLVRGFALSASDAEALLWQWAGGRPGWTREWVAVKVVHAERYGSEPMGGLVS